MSYFVTRKGHGWRLRETVDRGKAGKSWRHVSAASLEAKALGLHPMLSFEDARERVQTHRAGRKLQHLADKRKRLDARVAKIRLVASAWLPKAVVTEFELQVMPDENIPERHWRAVQRLIADVNLDPSEWRFRKKAIWSWFEGQKYSPDYTWRLLRIANLFQTLYCARLGKAWSDLPMPAGPALVEIRKTNRAARDGRQETFPLTLELLATAKKTLKPAEYAWLAVSLWFGLRPEEMDELRLDRQDTSWRIDWKVDSRFPVLRVLQWKLVREGVPEPEAWKLIPACEPEQKELLPVIEAGTLKRPGDRRIKRRVHPRLSPRSGRAYFVTLMHNGRGYTELVCSKWLGHRGLSTTRAHYERPDVVYYEPPSPKK